MNGRRGAAAFAIASMLVLSACHGDLPSVSPTCDDRDALTLMAQAVPQADAVLCFDELPFGFRATTFDVEAGSVSLALSHAVVGLDAVRFHLGAECTAPDTLEVVDRPSDGRREDAEHTANGGLVIRWIEPMGDACLVVDFNLDHPDGARVFEDVADSWRQIPAGEFDDE